MQMVDEDFSGAWQPDILQKAAKTLLDGVQWDRGDHWTKVGAKKSSSGAVTLGGPKEAGSLIYKALRDQTLVALVSAAA